MASKYTGAMPQVTEELRIVMVGKTGSGKSASGNTILGWECFESVMSPKSVTDECSKAEATVDGQDVAIIDTPGLYDTSKDEDTISRNISQCIHYACPGPHVFLIVIALGRYTKEEMKTVQQIQKLFGEDADRFSMVLFTRGDDLKGTIKEFIKDSPELQDLVDRCHGQYHVFNNNLKTGPQVTELLQKIRNIVKNNGGSHYTNEMFQAVGRAIEEERQRVLKEKEAEMREEREQLRTEIQAEFEEKIKNMEKEHQKRERQAKRREVRRHQLKERQDRERQLRREKRAALNQLKELEEKYKEKQNMELVVAREHQDREQKGREQMQNMLIALKMQNMQNMMEMQRQQQQQKWEIEKLRMEMKHREDLARQEKELDRARWQAEKAEFLQAQSKRELEITNRILQERRSRESSEREADLQRKRDRAQWQAEKADLLRAQSERKSSNGCSLM